MDNCIWRRAVERRMCRVLRDAADRFAGIAFV